MRHVKLLDCTLRDGAYLVNKTFGDSVISGMIEGLVLANIDIVEIGFLQDEGQGEGKTVFKNSKEAEKYIPKPRGEVIYTVLADYSRYSIENLDRYSGKSFDAVRACFFKNEGEGVLPFCREIKKKGYKLFVQPVDILGYTDRELLDLIDAVNEIEPYCFSIVDTFGSMYIDDLMRVYNIINHNLISSCKIGFHSHNNMQMSNALAQEFIRVSYGQREVVVDVTVSGMGRGAGNTPTELVAQYLVTKLGYNYDIDAILDIIDQYMKNICTKCSWGYSTPYFIAGSYGAHVNNISFLKQKNSINSKDIRYILNKIGVVERKRYNYELLEKTYTEYLKSDIDDTRDLLDLKEELGGRAVVIIVPGRSVEKAAIINKYIEDKGAITICVNFVPDEIECDYLYLNNIRRYNILKKTEKYKSIQKILTSNIVEKSDDSYVIKFSRLIKCGWENMDNSTIMLLRLLDILNVESIGIAGLDGYDKECRNYISDDMEQQQEMGYQSINDEIKEMLLNYVETREHKCKIECITRSRFEEVLK